MRKPDVLPLLRPEMREALAQGAAAAAACPPLPADPIAARRLAYAHERRFWNAAPVAIAAVEDDAVAVGGRRLPIRAYRPSRDAEARPPIVYLHGGGFVVGSLDTHDRIMRLLAKTADRKVIGVDYPLAPERKFPEALELVTAFCRDLARASGPIALAGDSAGAHLALAAALGLRGKAPMAGLLLYYGAFGLRDSASRRLHGGAADGLDEVELDFYRDAYLRSPADRRDPRYDLLANDLAGLPPTFVAAAALDPLLDDSRALAAGLAAAGVPHRLAVYEGVLHGFLHLSRALPVAHEALAAGGRFLVGGSVG